MKYHTHKLNFQQYPPFCIESELDIHKISTVSYKILCELLVCQVRWRNTHGSLAGCHLLIDKSTNW